MFGVRPTEGGGGSTGAWTPPSETTGALGGVGTFTIEPAGTEAGTPTSVPPPVPPKAKGTLPALAPATPLLSSAAASLPAEVCGGRPTPGPGPISAGVFNPVLKPV